MRRRNIGFVSFRFAGTDGVSLETSKWATVLERMGHRCYYCGGELETPAEQSILLPKAHFKHPRGPGNRRHPVRNRHPQAVGYQAHP